MRALWSLKQIFDSKNSLREIRIDKMQVHADCGKWYEILVCRIAYASKDGRQCQKGLNYLKVEILIKIGCPVNDCQCMDSVCLNHYEPRRISILRHH